MNNNLVQLVGGNFQDTLQNPVAYGILVLELVQEGQAIGYEFEDLSPFTTSEVCAGVTFTAPLDENGNIVASPGTFVFANNALQPPNSFYKCTVYTQRGELVWGSNNQQFNISYSPLVDVIDFGTLVPNQIYET